MTSGVLLWGVMAVFLLAACRDEPTILPTLSPTVEILEETAVSQITPTNTPTSTPTAISTPTIIPHTPTSTSIPLPTLAPTPEQDLGEVQLEMGNQIGGVARAMAIENNLIYLAVGLRLLVLDVTDPANPTQMGQSSLLDSVVADMVIENSVAYVLTESNELYGFDLANPTSPEAIYSMPVSPHITSMVIKNGFLYFTEGQKDDGRSNFLRIFAITNLDQPQEIVAVPIPGYAASVALFEKYAYVFYPEHWFIVDLSNPANPVPVEDLELGAFTGDYGSVQNNIMYVSGGPNIDEQGVVKGDGTTLIAYDVAKPLQPQRVSLLPGAAWWNWLRVAQSGNFLYRLHTDGELFTHAIFGALDISDLQQPIYYKSYLWGGEIAQEILFDNGLPYVLTNSGLYILDVNNPSEITVIGQWRTFGNISDVVASDDFVVVDSFGYSVDVLDPANPVQPQFLYQIADVGKSTKMTLKGGYLHLPTSEGVLNVINLTNQTSSPIDLAEKGPFASPNIVINEGYAYYLYNGLIVINISDLANPYEAFVFTGRTIDQWASVAISGTYAYLPNFEGLTVLDVSDPAESVEEVSFLPLPPEGANDVFIIGNYLYAFSGCTQDFCSENVWAIDISNPAAPQVTTIFNQDIGPHPLQVDNWLVYTTRGGIGVLDVSNPVYPRQVGFLPVSGEINQLAFVDGYVYAANGNRGLLILEFGGE